MIEIKVLSIFFMTFFVFAIVSINAQQKYEPVNPEATPEARKLLDYLYSISGNKIISGHQNFFPASEEFPEYVKSLTGKTPQIWGVDFFHYYSEGVADSMIKAAYNKYQQGYIITLMWHVGRPQDDPPFGWKESVQAEMTEEEWSEMTTPGTDLYKRLIARMDTIAGYLQELKNLGVPVLWRPFHEMNGIWFWWGDKKGKDGFAKLWKIMFERYVNYHKLNNLLWVWNTNTPRDLVNDEAYAYDLYFPGLNYVDVLAADVYHNDYKQSHHDQLDSLAQGKIIALGEVGEVPDPEILENQPKWTWFMIWGQWVKTHNTPEKIKDLYSSPRVLSHEDFVKKDKLKN
jgi:mannan endo-1,4-beta-mannosidase